VDAFAVERADDLNGRVIGQGEAAIVETLQVMQARRYQVRSRDSRHELVLTAPSARC